MRSNIECATMCGLSLGLDLGQNVPIFEAACQLCSRRHTALLMVLIGRAPLAPFVHQLHFTRMCKYIHTCVVQLQWGHGMGWPLASLLLWMDLRQAAHVSMSNRVMAEHA